MRFFLPSTKLGFFFFGRSWKIIKPFKIAADVKITLSYIMEASLKIIGIWLTLKILKTPRQFHSILDKISQKPVIIIFNCIYHLQVRDLSLALVMAKRVLLPSLGEKAASEYTMKSFLSIDDKGEGLVLGF